MNNLHRQEFQCFEHESGGQIISQKDLEFIGCPHCEIEQLRTALTIYADRQNWFISVGEAILTKDDHKEAPWRFGEDALKRDGPDGRGQSS